MDVDKALDQVDAAMTEWKRWLEETREDPTPIVIMAMLSATRSSLKTSLLARILAGMLITLAGFLVHGTLFVAGWLVMGVLFIERVSSITFVLPLDEVPSYREDLKLAALMEAIKTYEANRQLYASLKLVTYGYLISAILLFVMEVMAK